MPLTVAQKVVCDEIEWKCYFPVFEKRESPSKKAIDDFFNEARKSRDHFDYLRKRVRDKSRYGNFYREKMLELLLAKKKIPTDFKKWINFYRLNDL